MADLVWTDSLGAPRSLATRGDTAVAVIEDPGVLDIRPAASAEEIEHLCSELLGLKMPSAPWSGVSTEDMRVVWIGERRWRVLGDRQRINALAPALVERIGLAPLFDLTGAFSCFRIVGATAHEIIMRICPLDLRPIQPEEARGTSFAGVQTLLIRESSPNSWLALAPRSFSDHVAEALIEAARTPGRLALYEPADPPPV